MGLQAGWGLEFVIEGCQILWTRELSTSQARLASHAFRAPLGRTCRVTVRSTQFSIQVAPESRGNLDGRLHVGMRRVEVEDARPHHVALADDGVRQNASPLH